ncbi:MAG: hypothetical protein G01um101433_48 [Parcubacteria group bacterium Gr01-1014_33]|nr:MAG: hypothetical protein G01um101433_48 [Parcubacteria group bacterium Gr01-1014_33]
MDLKTILQFDILGPLGLTNASEDEKREMLEKVSTIVLGEVADRIKQRLNGGKQTEFELLFGNRDSSEKERMEFLRINVPDFEDIALEETLRLKLELMEPVRAA